MGGMAAGTDRPAWRRRVSDRLRRP